MISIYGSGYKEWKEFAEMDASREYIYII